MSVRFILCGVLCLTLAAILAAAAEVYWDSANADDSGLTEQNKAYLASKR